MFLAMFGKTQNIMLTMHISDVFQTIKKILKKVIYFSNVNHTINIRKLNSIFEAQKSYTEFNFWLNNQTLSLWSSQNQKHHGKHRAFSLTMRCLGDVFEKTSTSMFLTMFFKTQNIGQTMHLTMLIAHPYLSRATTASNCLDKTTERGRRMPQ